MVYDRDSNVTVYVDGAVSGTPAAMSTYSAEVPSASAPVLIGASGAHNKTTASLGLYFEGQLDEVRVYNRVLSVDDISVLMTTP